MDELDARIVKLVEKNARQTSDVIAKQLSVSSATVRRRLKRLLDTRELHIEAYRDLAKAGLTVSALIGLKIEHELHEQVMAAVSGLREVYWASTTTGRFDAFILSYSSSDEQLYLFLRDTLLKIKGIKDSETFLCLRVEKCSRFC
jgi:DNA-binding Lrp family transcriptional regulator